MAILIRSIPLPIFFISAFFFTIPPVSYFMTAYSYRIPIEQPLMIFARFNWVTYLFFVLSFFIGFGLLKAKKWAFYLFIGFSSVIVLYNVFSMGKVIFLPNHYSQFSVSGIVINTLVSLTILIGIFYFLQKEISAPYLSILPRGWRNNIRDTIPLPVKITNNKGESVTLPTDNVSINGIFVKLPDYTLINAGDTVNLTIFPEEKEPIPLQFTGEVTRTIDSDEGTPGAGIRFIKDQKFQESGQYLQSFLEEQYAPRYEIDGTASFEIKGKDETYSGTLYNLSSNGFFLETDSLPQKGDSIYLSLISLAVKRKVPAKVVWVNSEKINSKPKGFGAKFEKNVFFSLFPLLLKLSLKGSIKR
ncbi:MAG: PilZ domain-containing protein [Leptospiraceae bacterium]|nr:PilZ domain-containing protein [Leptospiraceae bacterium]